MIKKLSLLSLLALSATSAVAAEAIDSRFTFLSGGVAFDSNGLAKKENDDDSFKNLKKIDIIKDMPKKSSFGAYLTGAYSFDNNIFLEARLRYLTNRNNGYFAGVGYHYPLEAKTDVYVLGGISQFDTPTAIKFTENGKKAFNANKDYLSLKSQVAPSIEVGVRSMLTEELGVQASYRAAKETIKINGFSLITNQPVKEKDKPFSHELSLSAYYHFTPQLAAEAGYTYHRLGKLKESNIKATTNHRGTVGLRYAF